MDPQQINRMTESAATAFQRAQETYEQITLRAPSSAACEKFYQQNRSFLVAGASGAAVILGAEIAGLSFIGYMLGNAIAPNTPWLTWSITGVFAIGLFSIFHFLFTTLVPKQPFGAAIFQQWLAVREGQSKLTGPFNVYSVINERRRRRSGWLTFAAIAALAGLMGALRYCYVVIQDGSEPNTLFCLLNIVAGVFIAGLVAYAYAYFVTYREVKKEQRIDRQNQRQLTVQLRRFVHFASQLEYWYEKQATFANSHQHLFEPTIAVPVSVENLLRCYNDFRELGKPALIPQRSQAIRVMDGQNPLVGMNVIIQFDDNGRLSELTDSQGYVCFEWRSFSDSITVIEINGLLARNVQISDAPLTVPFRNAGHLSPSQQLN